MIRFKNTKLQLTSCDNFYKEKTSMVRMYQEKRTLPQGGKCLEMIINNIHIGIQMKNQTKTSIAKNSKPINLFSFLNASFFCVVLLAWLLAPSTDTHE